MLTAGDDYPIHQGPEPVAMVTDRNFYDRFFFNGYSADGRLFFSAAMGIYPALDVIDAAFDVVIDGVQHNLRASGRLNGERMAMAIGPISVTIDAPLMAATLRVAKNGESPLSAELHFAGRHFPIEEPRFMRRVGTRLFMDYTRLTQNGRWSGWIDVAGQRIAIDNTVTGTRDRSWGVRPVGKADAQPTPLAPQFFWLWTPTNLDGHSVYFHTNDDGHGRPWNRRAAIARDGGGRDELTEYEEPQFHIDWTSGGRRIREIRVDFDANTRLTLTPDPRRGANFYMNGLGYTHPEWGHGMDHGDLQIGYDTLIHDATDDNDYANMHIQAMADAVLTLDGKEHRGRGVVEQMFIGAHATTGLTGLFDPVA
jgi:hypothetical protein